jgi:hypothetical protein
MVGVRNHQIVSSEARNDVDMNVLESLVRCFVVDKNRSAKSSECSGHCARDSSGDFKHFVSKVLPQVVKRHLVRDRANQNLARIRAALLASEYNEYVRRTESDEILVVGTTADRAQRTRVTRCLQVAA